MRVYHFVPAQYGLENITKRRVKLATIKDLNDPFELLWLTSKDRSIRRAISNTKRDLGKMAGLVCFCPDWSNPVMWSHYADRHRGLCLGFDVPDQFLIHVDYVSSRQVLTMDTDRAIKDRSFRTKFDHWRYENELRLFDNIRVLKQEKGLYFKPFSEELSLREVIVGPLSKVKKSDVEERLADLGGSVGIKKARLAFQDYAVTEQRNVRRW